MFVFLLMPPLLFNDLAVDGTSQCQQQLQLSLRHAPALHLEIVQEGLARGVLPIMDANLRTRCMDALVIHATLYNDRAVTPVLLSAWLDMDMMFRYLGKVGIIMDTLRIPNSAAHAGGLPARHGPGERCAA